MLIGDVNSDKIELFVVGCVVAAILFVWLINDDGNPTKSLLIWSLPFDDNTLFKPKSITLCILFVEFRLLILFVVVVVVLTSKPSKSRKSALFVVVSLAFLLFFCKVTEFDKSVAMLLLVLVMV